MSGLTFTLDCSNARLQRARFAKARVSWKVKTCTKSFARFFFEPFILVRDLCFKYLVAIRKRCFIKPYRQFWRRSNDLEKKFNVRKVDWNFCKVIITLKRFDGFTTNLHFNYPYARLIKVDGWNVRSACPFKLLILTFNLITNGCVARKFDENVARELHLYFIGMLEN